MKSNIPPADARVEAEASDGAASSPAITSQSQELQSRIQLLANEVNSLKARAGAALGGAVFMLLLSGFFAWDILTARTGVWRGTGLDESEIKSLAAVLGLAGALLLCLGVFKLQPAARRSASRLAVLEREYDQLVDSSRADPVSNQPTTTS